jgi:tripartite-type tricarboxylate transporter receptor subunit TctC
VGSLHDFITWSRANPKQAAFASPGNGTTPHFAGIALNRAGNLDLTHVAYKGGAPAMNDVMGGQIASNMAVISNALPHIQAGKVRALVVTGPVRSTALPAVPTMAEAGYPDASVTESFGLYLPAKTAPELVLKLNALLREAMASKAYHEVLAKSSFDPAPTLSPAEYTQQIKAETTRWAAIVKASGFTPED